MDLLTIYNATLLHTKISVDGKDIEVEPKATKMVNVREMQKLISVSTLAKNFDGTITKNLIVIPKNGVSKIYITVSGIQTNLTAGKGIISNSSTTTAIIFVEVGSDGRRWPKCILTPGSFTEEIISAGGLWQVVTPERENVVIANFKVPKGVRSLNFDGERISV